MTNDLGEAIAAFGDAQRRDGVNPETVDSFQRACGLFADWMRAGGHATVMDQVATSHVEDWEAQLRQTMPHDTFHDNHRGVQQFLGWYAKQRDPDWRTRSAWRRARVEAPGR
jgi:hypothetical protein